MARDIHFPMYIGSARRVINYLPANFLYFFFIKSASPLLILPIRYTHNIFSQIDTFRLHTYYICTYPVENSFVNNLLLVTPTAGV